MSVNTNVPGSYGAGANDAPGTVVGTSADGSYRSVQLLDAGLCSKVIRQLPMMGSFFKNVKNAMTGIQNQAQANAGVLRNLMQTQADFNNETNLLNYWMRQINPHLDQTNLQLLQANDAMANLDMGDGPSEGDRPGVPTAITVLPFVTGGQALFFWVPSSYRGSSSVYRYNYKVFRTTTGVGGASAQVNASNSSTFDLAPTLSITDVDAKRTTTDAPPGVIFTGQDSDLYLGLDLYEMYGVDLRAVIISSAPDAISEDELSVRICAVNTSEVNAGDLSGQWSAASRSCKTLPTSGGVTNPTVTNVETGVNYHLVSWMHPTVQQVDGTPAPLAGVNGYNINGTATAGVFPVVGTAGCGVQVAGTRTLVQVPRVVAGSPLISTITPKVNVTSCSDIAVTAIPGGTSSDFIHFTLNATTPPPRIHVQIQGTTANVNAMMSNFYDPGQITYTVTAHDLTTNLVADDVTASAITTAHSSSQPALASTSVTVALTGLTSGHQYSFTAIASVPNIPSASGQSAVLVNFVSVACASVGPFQL